MQKNERPKITEAIATARAHGDLKENAEYHAAREKQSFVEGRIQAINAHLSTAQVIDPKTLPPSDKVRFASKVVVDDQGELSTYHIVGEMETDLEQGKIAFNSPLAKALIGKTAGDLAVVQTPKGDKSITLKKVLN